MDDKADKIIKNIISHIKHRYAITNKNTQATANILAHIIGFNPVYVRHANSHFLTVLCGTLLYYYLHGYERHLIKQKLVTMLQGSNEDKMLGTKLLKKWPRRTASRSQG